MIFSCGMLMVSLIILSLGFDWMSFLMFIVGYINFVFDILTEEQDT